MRAYTCLPLKYSTHTENCQLRQREKEPECTIYRLARTHTHVKFNKETLGKRALYELTWATLQIELNGFSFSNVCLSGCLLAHYIDVLTTAGLYTQSFYMHGEKEYKATAATACEHKRRQIYSNVAEYKEHIVNEIDTVKTHTKEISYGKHSSICVCV